MLVEDIMYTWLEKKFGQVEQVVNTEPKVGRNDPCPCGSGKKNSRSATAPERWPLPIDKVSVMHRLVIQAPEIATQNLKQLARLSGAGEIQAIHQQAFRLIGADISNQEAVADFCESAQLDWAFIPEDLSVRDIGLVVMDMDSTLITIECIDEIADMVGIKPQVAEITAAAMRGELDFKASLTRRVALLAGLEVGALQRVYDERLQLMPGARRCSKAFSKRARKRC